MTSDTLMTPDILMLYSELIIVGELGNRLRMRRQTLEPDLGNSSGGNEEIFL